MSPSLYFVCLEYVGRELTKKSHQKENGSNNLKSTTLSVIMLILYIG